MRKIIITVVFVFSSQIIFSQPGIKKINKSVYQLLQGKWQSVDDKNDYLIFKGNIRKEVYGKTSDADKYWLSNSCGSSYSISAKNKNGKYIVQKDNMCWGVEVDNSNLVLTYISRGNILTYKKINTENSSF